MASGSPERERHAPERRWSSGQPTTKIKVRRRRGGSGKSNSSGKLHGRYCRDSKVLEVFNFLSFVVSLVEREKEGRTKRRNAEVESERGQQKGGRVNKEVL